MLTKFKIFINNIALSTLVSEESLMNMRHQILSLTTKWNLVNEAAQLLDIMIPYLKNKKPNTLDKNVQDLCFSAIKENRPEIFQNIILRDPDAIKNFIRPLNLYFLFNFKNKVSFCFI